MVQLHCPGCQERGERIVTLERRIAELKANVHDKNRGRDSLLLRPANPSRMVFLICLRCLFDIIFDEFCIGRVVSDSTCIRT